VDWNIFDPFDIPSGSSVVFYTTKASLRKMEEGPVSRLVESEARRVVANAHVTTFRPAYLFIENLLHYRDISEVVKKGQFDRAVFLQLVDRYERAEIYSGTEPQARALAATLGGWWNRTDRVGDRVTVVSCENWDALTPIPPRSTVARLYLFSPARSALLAAQRDLFIRLSCAEVLTKSFLDLHPSFETLIAWLGLPGTSAEAQTVIQACDTYHCKLYEMARTAKKEGDASSFTGMTLAYNRISRGETLRETFCNPLEFANTLIDHHEPPAGGRSQAPNAARLEA
jgi:hypothetical protein